MCFCSPKLKSLNGILSALYYKGRWIKNTDLGRAGGRTEVTMSLCMVTLYRPIHPEWTQQCIQTRCPSGLGWPLQSWHPRWTSPRQRQRHWQLWRTEHSESASWCVQAIWRETPTEVAVPLVNFPWIFIGLNIGLEIIQSHTHTILIKLEEKKKRCLRSHTHTLTHKKRLQHSVWLHSEDVKSNANWMWPEI